VTPPGFQGVGCGSCWSFATTGALEGHIFRRTGVLASLSQQNLVDCADDYGNMGCDGGFQEYGFEYIRDHGVTLANKYPYTQSEMQCRQNETAGRPPRESPGQTSSHQLTWSIICGSAIPICSGCNWAPGTVTKLATDGFVGCWSR